MLLNFFLLFKFMNNTTVPQHTTIEGSHNHDTTEELLSEAKKMNLEKIFLEIGEFIKNYFILADKASNSEKFSGFKNKIVRKITKNYIYHDLFHLGLKFCRKIELILYFIIGKMKEFEVKYKEIYFKKISINEKCLEALNEIFEEDIGFELFQAWEMKMGDDFENKLNKKLENIEETKVKED